MAQKPSPDITLSADDRDVPVFRLDSADDAHVEFPSTSQQGHGLLHSSPTPHGRLPTASHPRLVRHGTESEPSIPRPRKESSPKRVSFENTDPSTFPSFQNVARALGHHSSDPNIADGRGTTTQDAERSVSPRRRAVLWPLNRLHSREEPFRPKDPYRITSMDRLARRREIIEDFAEQTIRQIYRHIMLRLPSLYFNRVGRLFEEAEVSRPEVDRLVEGVVSGAAFPRDWNPPNVSNALKRFKQSWEEFIESLLREWKTLNVVSALLLSAILTVFQIQSATDAPITRTAALLSLVCALMSLLYGCVYILRFSTMRDMRKASRWAQEAQRSTNSIFWNVWIFLALPVVWLSWSMIFFCISILAFIWTSGTGNNETPLPAPQIYGPRVAITFLFLVGLVYFIMIIRTFQSYSEPGEPLMYSPRLVPVLIGSNNSGHRGRTSRKGVGDEEDGLNPPNVLSMSSVHEGEELKQVDPK